MSAATMHATLRGLVSEVHSEPDGAKAAIKAMAVVHLFHIMDVMLSAGHDLPGAWNAAIPDTANNGV